VHHRHVHGAVEQLFGERDFVARAWFCVLVAIEDNGRGFDPDKIFEVPEDHLGLQVMRERAEMSGGWLKVDSPFGRGTTVEFWIPIDA